MSDFLLATKLYIPRARLNAIARPRLTERLLAGVNQPGSLVLLSGSAGFGKTTLLSEFAVKFQRPVAWLSLDEEDNDPSRFWTYLIAACRSVQNGVGEAALALLHTPQPLPDDAVTAILINDLTQLNSDLVLVLDDYHVIRNQSIHAALYFLLDHIPAQLHIVLSTRIDPPWPLARLRARNQLTEIRAADLRFTPDEAAAFLNRVMSLNLSAEEVAALEARTEGWIAGLQLAAISMKGRGDVAGFIKALTGSHVYIADYLVEEVLSRQSERIQDFLLKTSILDRLNASLCEAITGDPDGQATLLTLHHANLFIIPLDDEGQWFRYHHLFADLLQSRLRQTLGGSEIAALHTRASRWYEHYGFVIEAVNHALAARDFDDAARLIEDNTHPLMTRGELTTLLHWIEALPDEVIQHRPLCTLAKAWVLIFAGAFQQVELLLREAEVHIAADDETLIAHEVRGNAAAMRAFIAIMAGDNERALELAERAKVLLPESSVSDGSAAPFDFGARSIVPFTLGTVYRGQGQYEKAAQAFEREVQMGEEAGDDFIWVNAVVEVVNTRRVQGKLREARELCRHAQRRMAEQGMSPFGSFAKLDVALSEVLREQNELDEARQRVTGAMARMPAWSMPVDQLFAHLVLVHIQESQGDLANAFETLRAAKNLEATYPAATSVLSRTVVLDEIRLHLASGDFVTAARLMGSIQVNASQIVFLREQELIVLARVRLAQGRPDKAASILSQIARDPGIRERMSLWIEALTLQACVLKTLGDQEAALNVLIKALALAEPEGFVRVFVDEGKAMKSLIADCRLMIENGSATLDERLNLLPYIDRLLTAFPSIAPQTTPLESEIPQGRDAVQNQQHLHRAADAVPVSPILVEPLTPRELEILHLIAAGDSNRMIAEKLVITVSAVKKHTSNIFGKLNVNSRTQAVARARQIGLLSSDT